MDYVKHIPQSQIVNRWKVMPKDAKSAPMGTTLRKMGKVVCYLTKNTAECKSPIPTSATNATRDTVMRMGTVKDISSV
jgi:hypothetical protein